MSKDNLAKVIQGELNKQFKHQKVAYFLDGDENPTLFINFNDSSKKYSYDEYRILLGKSTLIKEKYFTENKIDMKVFNTLIEYSKRNIFPAVISDISEEIDEKTNKFIKSEAKAKRKEEGKKKAKETREAKKKKKKSSAQSNAMDRLLNPDKYK